MIDEDLRQSLALQIVLEAVRELCMLQWKGRGGEGGGGGGVMHVCEWQALAVPHSHRVRGSRVSRSGFLSPCVQRRKTDIMFHIITC